MKAGGAVAARAGSRKQEAGSREQEAGSREQEVSGAEVGAEGIYTPGQCGRGKEAADPEPGWPLERPLCAGPASLLPSLVTGLNVRSPDHLE